MIIGGVELITLRNHGGLWLPGVQLSITATTPGSLPPNTLPIDPDPPSTQRFGSRSEQDVSSQRPMGQWTKTEPRPFILIGGRPTTIGTAVFSNPTVQEWVREKIGWDDPHVVTIESTF